MAIIRTCNFKEQSASCPTGKCRTVEYLEVELRMQTLQIENAKFSMFADHRQNNDCQICKTRNNLSLISCQRRWQVHYLDDHFPIKWKLNIFIGYASTFSKEALAKHTPVRFEVFDGTYNEQVQPKREPKVRDQGFWSRTNISQADTEECVCRAPSMALRCLLAYSDH